MSSGVLASYFLSECLLIALQLRPSPLGEFTVSYMPITAKMTRPDIEEWILGLYGRWLAIVLFSGFVFIFFFGFLVD